MDDLDRLVAHCIEKDIPIAMHNHPKSKVNWDKDWQPHDEKSVNPNHPQYRKARAR